VNTDVSSVFDVAYVASSISVLITVF